MGVLHRNLQSIYLSNFWTGQVEKKYACVAAFTSETIY